MNKLHDFSPEDGLGLSQWPSRQMEKDLADAEIQPTSEQGQTNQPNYDDIQVNNFDLLKWSSKDRNASSFHKSLRSITEQSVIKENFNPFLDKEVVIKMLGMMVLASGHEVNQANLHHAVKSANPLFKHSFVVSTLDKVRKSYLNRLRIKFDIEDQVLDAAAKYRFANDLEDKDSPVSFVVRTAFELANQDRETIERQ